MKVDNKENEGALLCSIKKHKSYFAVDYEELQNSNFFQSDEDEDNAEFLIINPDLLDLDLDDNNSVSNATVVSEIIDNFFPNEQFYEICSQLNKGLQNLFNFIIQ